MSGIYKITNLIDDREYVGSAVVFKERWQKHRRDLRQNKHHSQHLQNFYNKYGLENIAFEILEECEPIKAILLVREQYYLDTLKPAFNSFKFAYSALGLVHTEKSKQAMREKQSKRPICQYSLDGKFIKYWNSAMEVQATLGFNHSEISACVREYKKYTSHMFMWKKFEGSLEDIEPCKTNGLFTQIGVKINQVDKDGNIIKEFESAKIAAKELNVLHSNILKVCKGERITTGGYYFQYN